MPIKNKALLLLTSILTANTFILNAFAMRDQEDNNYSEIDDNYSEINDYFAELKNNYGYKQIVYNIGDVEYKDLLDLYKNNKPNLIQNGFGIFGESGIVNKNNNYSNKNFIRILKSNLRHMTQSESAEFVASMKPTFEKFNISIDDSNMKYANESMNSTILNYIINKHEFSNNEIVSAILSYYWNKYKNSNKDKRLEFDNFLIKLEILSLDVNKKFDLFRNLCQEYSSNIKQRNNLFNNVFNSIIPALANMVLYELNNASEYNDNTDAIVCNVLSTMTQLHKYNNRIDLSELNRNIVKYITSMNYDDSDFNDAQFANNPLAINLMYYYNRTLKGYNRISQGRIKSVEENLNIDLFNDENIAEHLKTVSENVITHYADLNNGVNSVDQRILASFSIDDSSNNIESENLIEMQRSIIAHNNKEELPLIKLLSLVSDTNYYNYKSKEYNFAHFRNEFRNSKDSTQSYIDNVEDLINAMSNMEQNILISNSLRKKLYFGQQYQDYNGEILQIIARYATRQENQNTYLINNNNVKTIFLEILKKYVNANDAKTFSQYFDSKCEKELIGKLIQQTSRNEVNNVIADYLYGKCLKYLESESLYFHQYLYWFLEYSDFATKNKKEHENYDDTSSYLRTTIAEEMNNEYQECANVTDEKQKIKNVIKFFIKYHDHDSNQFDEDIINPEEFKNDKETSEIVTEFTNRFWENNSIEQFKQYKEVNKLLMKALQCNNNIGVREQYNNHELLNILLMDSDLYDFEVNSGKKTNLPQQISKEYEEYFKQVKLSILEYTKYNKELLNTLGRNTVAYGLSNIVEDFIKKVNGFIDNNSDELNIKIGKYNISHCAAKFIEFVLSHDHESCAEILNKINALQFIRIMKMIESSSSYDNKLDEQQYSSYLLQSAILKICDNIDNHEYLLKALYDNIDELNTLSNSISKIKTLDINNSNDIRLLNYLGEKRNIPHFIKKIQPMIRKDIEYVKKQSSDDESNINDTNNINDINRKNNINNTNIKKKNNINNINIKKKNNTNNINIKKKNNISDINKNEKTPNNNEIYNNINPDEIDELDNERDSQCNKQYKIDHKHYYDDGYSD